MRTEKDLNYKRLFKGRTSTRFYHNLQLITEHLLSLINGICAGIVDNMFGLVAQSGRAPGFYSKEKIPDGRGFKSLRARSVREDTV